MLWTSSCTPSAEHSRLTHIESIIDDRPDSALTLLATIDTAALHSDADRALFAMLHNLAVFKSFSDSLDEDALNRAADYFIEARDNSRASRTLYLLGNLQMARKQLGSAAVSLTRGLELASENNDFFNQGLCAFSLYELFGDSYDTNRQITYARKASDYFRLARKSDWEQFALVYLAGAYINIDRNDSAMYVLNEVLQNPTTLRDSSLIALASESYALAAYKSNQSSDAVKYYANAYRHDSISVAGTGSIFNIRMLLDFRDISKATQEDVEILRRLVDADTSAIPFHILARQNRYKEAYEEIEKYRMMQDDFISNVMNRTVDSSIAQYQKQQNILLDNRLKAIQRNRIFTAVIVFLIAVASILWVRSRLIRKHYENEKLVERARFLSETLNMYMEKSGYLSDNMKGLFRDKFNTIDRLCAAYYETNSKRTVSEVKSIIHDLISGPEGLQEIERNIDLQSDNLIARFREEMPGLKDYEYTLFIYSALHFSTNSIALLTDVKKEVLYNRKSRLKAKIHDSNAPHKDPFIEALR